MAKPKIEIGTRIDKLTVIKEAVIFSKRKRRDSEGVVYYEQGKTKYKGWLCKCDCGREVEIKQSDLTKNNLKYLHSCGKCPKVENPNYKAPDRNTPWDNLYEYVRTNILNYSKDQALSQSMVSRLKGLTTGNYMRNSKVETRANYSYEVVLNTFKICSPNIKEALRTVRFQDEGHKFNYICKIVENNINDTYVRMKRLEKAKEETKKEVETNVNIYTHQPAEYKPRKKDKKDKFSDLW